MITLAVRITLLLQLKAKNPSYNHSCDLVLILRPVVKNSATSHSHCLLLHSILSAAKTLDLGISGVGVPEGKPISVTTVVDRGSTVVLVRGVVLGGNTSLALEGNAPPDIWRT